MLAGARSDAQEDELRRLLLRFELQQFATSDFDAAMLIYRRCRRAGVMPRGLIDRIIAAVAWRRNATLLSHDADLGRVAKVVGIERDKASLRA